MAESASDVECLKVLLRRMTGNQSLAVESYAARGCPNLFKDCPGRAEALAAAGCTLLILVHDRDQEDLVELRSRLEARLANCSIRKRLVCIPVEELEAWWFADLPGVQRAFGLQRPPKHGAPPESIPSPKERLARLVENCAEGRLRVTERDNARIAASVDLAALERKCPSFLPLKKFVETHFPPPHS